MGLGKLIKKVSPYEYTRQGMKHVFNEWDDIEKPFEETWDAVKPIAGIIAGAALLFVPGIGPALTAAAWGSIIGSGMSTGMGLIQGQSWEETGDASLKAGLIGGASGGIGGAAGGAWGGAAGSKLGVTAATGAKIVGAAAGGITGAGLTAADGGSGMEVVMGGAGGAAAGWAGGGAVAKANLAARTSVATSRAGGTMSYSNQIGSDFANKTTALGGATPYSSGLGGFETVQTGAVNGPMMAGQTGFSAVPAGSFTSYTATEQAISQNAVAQSLAESLNPMYDKAGFAAKAAVAMMMGATSITENNMLTVQGMSDTPDPVLDSTITSGIRQPDPTPIVDDTAGGLAWDRTMGNLFGGTDLLASTMPRPTDKKTQAGVSDALLTQNGALMV